MSINRVEYGVPDGIWPHLKPDQVLQPAQVTALTFALGECLNGIGFPASHAVDFISCVIEEMFDDNLDTGEFWHGIEAMKAAMVIMGLDPDAGQEEAEAERQAELNIPESFDPRELDDSDEKPF